MSSRVLVVTSVATQKIFLKSSLDAAYFPVCCADLSRDICAQAIDHQADVILASHDALAANDGALMHALKTTDATKNIPVAAIVSASVEAERTGALRLGADDILTQPISHITLHARVRALARFAATNEEFERRQTAALEIGAQLPSDQRPTDATVQLVFMDTRGGEEWRDGAGCNVIADAQVLTYSDVMTRTVAHECADLYLIYAPQPLRERAVCLIKQLRSHRQTRKCAIILIHDAQDLDTAAHALDVGANDILTRTATHDEIRARVSTQISRRMRALALNKIVDHGLKLASLDPLTGIYNRRYATAHLERVSQHVQDRQRDFALLLVDIDHFKNVNDTYGHRAGDEVLKGVVRRLADRLRPEDLLSRFGGEEFLICLPNTHIEAAQQVAERLRLGMCENDILTSDGQELRISVSIGVTCSANLAPSNIGLVDQMLASADRALYVAKEAGRNQIALGHGQAA